MKKQTSKNNQSINVMGILFIGLLFTATAFAEDKNYQFGGLIGTGTISGDESDFGFNGQLNANYWLNENFAVESRIIGQANLVTPSIHGAIDGKKVSSAYGGYTLGIKAEHSILGGIKLYGNTGINYMQYQIEQINDSEKNAMLFKDSGFNPYIGAGLEWRFADDKFGFTLVDVQRMKLPGGHFATTYTSGFNIRF